VAENEPIIVFLVPQKLADKYNYQKLDPPKAPFNKWRQYVCGLDENQIWGLSQPERRVVSEPTKTLLVKMVRDL
jgi:hypothetical protein